MKRLSTLLALSMIMLPTQTMPVSVKSKAILSGCGTIIAAGLHALSYASFYRHFNGTEVSSSYISFLNILITGKVGKAKLKQDIRIPNSTLILKRAPIIATALLGATCGYQFRQLKKERDLEKLKDKTTEQQPHNKLKSSVLT